MKFFINVKRIFIFLYVMAITALLVLPSLKYTFSLVQILFFSLPLVILALIEGKTYRKVFAINMVVLAITFLSTFIFNYKGGLSGTFNIVVPMYLYILPFLICQYLIDLNDKTLMKWVTVVTSCILFYIMLITFRQLLIDPTIARNLAYGTIDDPYLSQQRMKNIGGFGFCYCLCMFVPYVTTLLSRVRKKQKKLLVFLLILLLVFSVYSQYTTFILLSVISIFYVIITQGKMSVQKIVAIVLLLIIVFSFKSILWWLANNINLSSLSHHFYNLYYTLEGESDIGRWNMYRANLAMFLRNPIFGADLTISYNNYLFTSAHSQLFGRLSGGGIVGFGVYAGFIVSAWYYLAKKSGMRYLLPVFLTHIVLAFLNPVQPEIAVAVFMIIPLIEYQFINRKDGYYV